MQLDADVVFFIANRALARNMVRQSATSSPSDCVVHAISSLLKLDFNKVKVELGVDTDTKDGGVSTDIICLYLLSKGVGTVPLVSKDIDKDATLSKAEILKWSQIAPCLVGRIVPGGEAHLCASDGVYVLDPLFPENIKLDEWEPDYVFLCYRAL